MEKKNNKRRPYRVLRIIAKTLLGILVFLLLLLLFIRSQWGQQIIKEELVSTISDKTNTRIEVERLFITFSGNLFLEGLYMEDKEGDTLVYSHALEADVPLWSIIRGGDIIINSVTSAGLKANIVREDSINGFNYEFLMEAFAPADSTATSPVDTTKSKRNFIIEDIKVTDLDLVFKDGVAGIDSHFEVGTLGMKMEVFDLENLKFNASEAVLSDSKIYYVQTKSPPEEETSKEVPLPFIVVEELSLKNVLAIYESVPDGMLADLNIGTLSLKLPEADLPGKNIDVEYFHLKDSDVSLQLTDAVSDQEEEITEVEEGFQWPDWNVQADEILLKEVGMAYNLGGAKAEEGRFNPQALQFQNLNLIGRDLFLKDKAAGANLGKFSFKEASGLHLRKAEFTARIDENSLNLEDLVLHLNNNRLKGNLNIRYESIDELLETPEQASVVANIPEFYFHPEELFRFQPDLRSNEMIRKLTARNLFGHIQVEGSLSSLQISSSSLNWGSTKLRAQGRLQNLLQTEELYFDFPSINLYTSREDLSRFLQEDSLGIQLPKELTLQGSMEGTAEKLTADAELMSSKGNVSFQGNYSSENFLAFDGEVQIVNLELGDLLGNHSLGNLNLTLSASGQGENLNTLDATLTSNISSFSFNGYPITDLDLTGEIENGRGPIGMAYRDENLNMEMESILILDTISPQVNMDFDVMGANLQELGFTTRLIKVGFGLDASFRGNFEEYDVNAEIVDGVTVYGNKSYLLGDFLLSARVRPDSTAMDIRNQLLDVHLRSNADPASFANAMQRHYRSYLSETVETDTIEDPVNLQFQAEIRENPILDEVFFAQLEELDTVDIAVEFHESSREMTADIELPYLSYMGSEVDSLSLRLDSDKDNFEVVFGFNEINAGPVSIKKTALSGNIVDKLLHLDFISEHEGKELVYLQSEITRRSDTVTLTLDPSKVILDGKLWEVPESNLIRVAPNFMAFEDFYLQNESQQIEITDDRADIDKEHIALTFENFSLGAFLSYFNPEEPLASGNLDGNLTVEDPFGTKGLLADVEINQFSLLKVPMGVLSLDAEALSFNDYDFDLAIKEGNVDLDLTGGFTASPEGAQWFTELDLNRVEMEVVEAFSFGEIREGEGSFSGQLDLSGTFVDPQYIGKLIFDQAGFTVTKLDAPFKIQEETIEVKTEGFYFDDFQIEDQDSNVFAVDGELLTENLLNPEFDLSFQAQDFMLLNSTSEDNDLFYGTAVFDVEAELTGTLNVPNLTVDLEVGPESNITYVIPESEVGIERREGIVAFVNRENPDAILTATEKESYVVTGMEITSTIAIDEEAVINVVINEETGDNLQVRGEGNLLFNIYSNGRTTLAGRYLMSGGHYEMNLYGLVNRRFEIAEGSSITWSGDPFDANLNLRARYTVETSASDLMAPATAGADTSVRNRFRQELPFIVYLDIGGELMQPVLNFGLDMPENEQGAIGGQVYGRVQQINQQEQELNQQVFSLLVLNRFYPHSGTDGSGGGTLNIARDNLNDALSDQLNVLSSDIIGSSSFALDFGLDTYTDYQGQRPQERTQLDISAEKAFMDERLVARVGSEVDIQGNAAPGQETPLIGNVSLEYLITENGVWRIRGFRSNRFENVIEGQVIVSGIALIFQREFNKFKELFQKVKNEESK